MKALLTILGIAVLAGVIWWAVARNNADNTTGDNNSQIMCTQDVQQCSDGSYVSRDPNNNCAFRACPNGASSTDEQNGAPIFDKG